VRIPNGIRLPRAIGEGERRAARTELAIHEDEPVVAVIGRFSVEKGHRALIAALRDIRSGRAESRLPLTLFVGDGPERPAVQAQAGNLPIRMLGFQRDVRRFYAATDLVVIPSRTEGLPLVALEAMSCGRAVVAFAVGDLPTLLRDGGGALVPAQDTRALARTIERLLEDTGARTQLAKVGQARVRHEYSSETMALSYAEQLYLPAMAGSALGRRPRSQSPAI
jgi:glycosyltransferase involved in cell wall biosynthesis